MDHQILWRFRDGRIELLQSIRSAASWPQPLQCKVAPVGAAERSSYDPACTADFLKPSVGVAIDMARYVRL